MKISEIINILISFIGIIITFCAQAIVFSKISNSKPKITFSKIIAIVLIIILVYLNSYYNYNYTKAILSFAFIILLNKIIFNKQFTATFLVSVISYLFGGLLELIFSVLLFSFSIRNAITFDENSLLKILFSILIVLVELFLIKIKTIKNILKKTYNYIDKQNNLFVLFVVLMIFLFLINLLFKNGYDGSIINSLTNFLLLIMSMVFMTVIYIKIKKEKEFIKKEESLLGFMSEYEKIIDNNRYQNHELVNNLLLIRDYCDKNSETSKELINELIQTYDNSKFKKIYNLPPGLKGLFYYKIALIKEDTNFIFNCSDKVEKKLMQIDDKRYKNLYKALSIILDNAVEAIQKAKDKVLIIDIYFEKKDLNFYIENSFRGKIDKSRIYEKNYSSKGKKRGLGLYILKTIVSKASELSLEQKINGNKFITILKIDFLS